MNDLSFLCLLPILAILIAVVADIYAKLGPTTQRIVGWGLAVLMLLGLLSLVGTVLVVQVSAQDAPVIIQVDPVVIDGDSPALKYWQWFIADATDFGVIRAVRIALGHGVNEDGWFEAALVFQFGLDREPAEYLTRLLHRVLFGATIPRGAANRV